jgi:hypothetical protein
MHVSPNETTTPPFAALVALLAAMALTGCPGEDTSDNNGTDLDMGGDTGPTISCPVGFVYDAEREECIDPDADMGADMGPADAGTDAGPTDMGPGDTGLDGGGDLGGEPDMPAMVDMGADMGCDKDNDGALSEACGGDDCDDSNFDRSPDRVEICDEIDNNCDPNEEVNENLECRFFAHTRDDLYAVDPFELTATVLTSMSSGEGSILDIDTAPNGALYGVTQTALMRYNPGTQQWDKQGDLDQGGQTPGDPNGMAIDRSGTAFVTSENELFEVDLTSGAATKVGDVGQFTSSGDCVINKTNTLYMTSKRQGMNDELVEVDRTTGNGIKVGDIGASQVFGLTFAWGQLYGLTVDGELLTIDRQTAATNLVHTFRDGGDVLGWYGAASTPDR